MTGQLQCVESVPGASTCERAAELAELAKLTSEQSLLLQAAAEPTLLRALLASAAAEKERPLCQSLLSDRAILSHLLRGSVVVRPFRLSHLSTSSYDVTLGAAYYREAAPEPGCALYNPYCPAMVRRVWGEARRAERHSVYLERTGQPALQGIAADDELIWIAPGETILAHTNEYIGGRGTVTTMMKARSSMGRNFIEVCKCAGWGDIGYTNRWTMEVTNNSRFYSIPLVVGRRIAQIIFFDSDGTVQQQEGGTTSYELSGKYQTSSDMDAVTRSWQPSDMLPKMYKDKECTAVQQQQQQQLDSQGVGCSRWHESREESKEQR